MTTIRSGKTCLLSSMSNILLSKGSNVDEELILSLIHISEPTRPY